MKQFTVWK